ncbi:HlyD family type I secretion periplasmic adaptor subunit [Bradyrhizobium sp. JYMT SZCCT0428]|uniref:HlyD family type I secretion periplasmic adaptor subunit n=1 Tax=Bradyrhizobium sp. JYMT SZCCT0428 TaxID=2807673 RepID=UPI001BA4E485|nr:HlyD family type I secretion periplasmic adaptor subunit [Bradyrhizobium sp. JYMT SZCCT0428]MBR1153694.1 HlyD family type I secretion periplasmic adaptor subunit [Bradyrhizobium sp. JYMT SZCCT0428]
MNNKALNREALPPRDNLVPLKSAVSGRDREFLPSALEVLETPPSPVPVALMLTICAFVAAAIAWSFFGRLDVHAVAQGKIEASGRTKVIQPMDPGKVVSLAVENGTHVKAGDELIAFDPAEAEADARRLREAVSSAYAEIVRRQLAIRQARAWPSAPLLPVAAIQWKDDILPASRAREHQVLLADVSQLSETLGNIEQQIAQKNATRDRLNMSIKFQTELIKTLQDRVAVRETSLKLEVGTKINLFDAMESLDKSRSALASDTGQLLEAQAAVAELNSEKDKALATFVADNTTKLADAERKLEDTAQQYAKANTKLTRTKLYAPADGIVQQVAVTTVGQVVTTGQQLMTIVPNDGRFQVEVYVANTDIGFVKVGQDAVIKLDTFPFTRFGSLHGKVTRIATDAIDEQTARRQQANATSQVNAQNSAGVSPGQPQNFVFLVTIALDENAMKIDDAVIPLTPGMTLTAEIKTDSRRIIEYVLSPLARIASQALKER